METFFMTPALVAFSGLVVFAFAVQPRLNWPLRRSKSTFADECLVRVLVQIDGAIVLQRESPEVMAHRRQADRLNVGPLSGAQRKSSHMRRLCNRALLTLSGPRRTKTKTRCRQRSLGTFDPLQKVLTEDVGRAPPSHPTGVVAKTS